MFTDEFCGFALPVSVVRNLLGPISQLSPSFRSLISIYDWHERKQHPGNRAGRNRPRSLSASRAALRCNRIQLDAREAGPTSPVFFLCIPLRIQPRSGERMQPTAQAVGYLSENVFKPRRGERKSAASRELPAPGKHSSLLQSKLILPARCRDCIRPCGFST